jgi:uncharacterized membrane protein
MNDNKERQSLIDKLHQQGLIGDELNDNFGQRQSPWYIKLLMALCGWLSAVFLFGYVGFSFVSIFDTQTGLIIVGTIMVCGAYVFLTASVSESDFKEHLGLAISFAGQVLLAIAVFFEGFNNSAFAWAMLTVLHCVLAWFMPSFIHRMMSAYVATFCLSMLMAAIQLSAFYSGVVLLLVALLWLNEFNVGRHIRKVQAIGYGAVLGVIQFKTLTMFARHDQTWSQDTLPLINPWLDEGLNIVVLLFIVNLIVKYKNLVFSARQRVLAASLLLLVCVSTFFANGIVCGLVILLVGYAIQNRTLWVLGIISMLVNLSSYYYLLEISLLHKSFILMTLGVAALSIAYVLGKQATQGANNEK